MLVSGGTFLSLKEEGERGLTYVCFGSSVFSCSIFWDDITSLGGVVELWGLLNVLEGFLINSVFLARLNVCKLSLGLSWL